VDIEVSKLKFNREKEMLLGPGKEFADANGWEIVQLEYPVLSFVFTRPTGNRRLGFRFQCDQWDELPPSLTLFDPSSPKEELTWEKWPKNGWNAAASHKNYSKPFLCLPGIREYHTHENHQTDYWVNLRGKDSYTLLYIVERVRQKFGVTND
jgi:hypothetical protein